MIALERTFVRNKDPMGWAWNQMVQPNDMHDSMIEEAEQYAKKHELKIIKMKFNIIPVETFKVVGGGLFRAGEPISIWDHNNYSLEVKYKEIK
jgi:hypothetical protein